MKIRDIGLASYYILYELIKINARYFTVKNHYNEQDLVERLVILEFKDLGLKC